MTGLAFGSYCVAAVFLTPFLLHHLGDSAYGLIPLAGLFTQYAAIISAQLSGAINRFLVIELQKDGGNPNLIFNSALGLYGILIVLQIPLMVGLICSLNFFFDIPRELYTDVVILFACSSAAFLVSMLDSVFGLPVFAYNRLDISSSLDLSKQLLRFFGIILVFKFYGVALRYIGYIDLSLALGIFVCNLYFCRKFAPELKIDLHQIRMKILLPIFRMSFWTLLDNLGSLLFLRSDIWVINRFISAAAAGQYAAILVVGNFIKQIGLLLSRQIAPTTMTLFAQNKFAELQQLQRQMISMLTILTAFPVGIVLIFAPDILNIWLDKSYIPLAFILQLTVVHLVINIGGFPLFYLYVAMNKVKLNGIVLISAGLLNICVVYFLGVTMQWGLVGVAIGGGLILTLKNGLFTPWYGAHILHLQPMTFFYTLKNGILTLLGVTAIGWLVKTLLFNGGLIALLSCSTLIGVLGMIFVWILIFNHNDRESLMTFLPRKMQRYVKPMVF